MAENPSEYLTYVLAIEKKHEDFLGQIRHWSNLKIATNEGTLWIKNLTQKQIGSLEIKSIPFAQIYVLNENLLFPLGSNLPSLKLPSLLWTLINRGLPISLP